jgi:hypothetical protein
MTQMSGICQPFEGEMSGICQLDVGHLSENVGHLSAPQCQKRRCCRANSQKRGPLLEDISEDMKKKRLKEDALAREFSLRLVSG